MRVTPILATAIVTSVIALAGLALASPWPQTRDWSLAAEAQPAAGDRSWHRRHTSHSDCDWSTDEIGSHMAKLRDRLDLTAHQAAAWAEMDTAIREIAEAARPDCRKAHQSLAETDPVKMLDGIEIMLAAGVRATQKLRPSLERFYAGLSEAQRAEVTELLSHRRRRR